MVLAAILLCIDGASVVDKYSTASGLANAGCSLRKESSSRGTRGVLQLGLKWKDRDFLQHSLTNVHFNPSSFQCFAVRYLGEQVMVEYTFSNYMCRQNIALLFAHMFRSYICFLHKRCLTGHP